MAKKDEIEFSADDCTVTFNDLTITLHPTIYQYLFGEKSSIKVRDRASVIEKALNVGLLAAQQGRVAQAVKLFNSEIAGEYDLLSTHMDVLQHKLEKDNKFKTDLENDVVIALISHCTEMGYDDVVTSTGTVGKDGNKTGDALGRRWGVDVEDRFHACGLGCLLGDGGRRTRYQDGARLVELAGCR